MLHILSTALNAVLPIILLSIFGYWLKRIGFLSEQFIKTGSKMVFRVCLCCSMFINVYNINDISAVPWDVVLYSLTVICLLFILGLGSAIITTKLPERRAVVLHGVFRSNFAIIGLSLAASLGGDEAMSVAAVVSAFAIPLFNILGVVSLSMFTGHGDKKFSAWKFCLDVLKNPMILGALAGAVCILLRSFQEMIFGQVIFTISGNLPFVFETINKIKTMTTPLALIILGAQFEFSAVKGLLKEIVVGTAWRIVLAPLLGVGLAVVLSKYTDLVSFDQNTYPALIALFGAPAAVSTSVIASEMGGDEQLATQLVVWSSLGSIFTIYILVCLMMMAGLLVV